MNNIGSKPDNSVPGTRRKLSRGIVAGVALGCLNLSIAAVAQNAVTPTVSKVRCDEVKGLPSNWPKQALKFVLLGETHGTSEGPKVFGDLVCAELAAGRTVTVGLELPASDQKSYGAYMDSNGAPADREKIMQLWRSEMLRDGRTSIAMFELLERLRLMKAEGSDLTVFAFKPQGDFDQGRYEQRMAQGILDASKTNSDRLVLILVGNVHAAKSQEYAPGQMLPFQPMATHLPPDSTFSVKIKSRSGGSIWACIPNRKGTNTDSFGCGVHPIAPGEALGSASNVSTLVQYDKSQLGYDGEITVKSYTPSPPKADAP